MPRLPVSFLNSKRLGPILATLQTLLFACVNQNQGVCFSGDAPAIAWRNMSP